MKIYNRLLDDRARLEFAPEQYELEDRFPDLIARKIPRALVQQAFCVAAVRALLPQGGEVLAVGAYEDPSALLLSEDQKYAVTAIDPHWGCSLEGYHEEHPENLHDLVYACSVIEHVPDDETFLHAMGEMVRWGGYLVLTMDWQPTGSNLTPPSGTWRFYTTLDLLGRFRKILPNFRLIEPLEWEGEPDFEQYDLCYGFATFVAQKIK